MVRWKFLGLMYLAALAMCNIWSSVRFRSCPVISKFLVLNLVIRFCVWPPTLAILVLFGGVGKGLAKRLLVNMPHIAYYRNCEFSLCFSQRVDQLGRRMLQVLKDLKHHIEKRGFQLGGEATLFGCAAY